MAAPKNLFLPEIRRANSTCGLFFKTRPAFFGPSPDNPVVAFTGLSFRLLAAPSKLPKETPDMLRTKFNIKELLNNLCHALQRPQLRFVTMRLRAARQLSGKLPQLCLTQTRFSTGTTWELQPFAASLFPNIVPSPDCFTADMELAGHVRLNAPSSKQGCGFQPPLLETLKVSALEGFGIHKKMIPLLKNVVTIL
jgi:hypothetical protein